MVEEIWKYNTKTALDKHPERFILGARDGTRTHTAVATRTSNVIVYHSNTLAKPDYYNQ